MIRNFINKFSTTLYVQIWENRIKVTNTKTASIFDEKPLIDYQTKSNGKIQVLAFGNNAKPNSINPFSHPRVIFANFYAGEKLLQEIIKKLLSSSIFTPSPNIVIHPMEKTEGGLTMIEIRAFREMAHGAGAADSVIYEGNELQPQLINFSEMAKNNNDQWRN